MVIVQKSLRRIMKDNSEKKTPSRLDIDRPQDFKFHIAYDVYSRAWEDNTSESVRIKLNELISSLSNDENGYSRFYAQIQQYRRDFTYFSPGRTRIETQRKRAWQKNETRDRRNRRYR